MKKAILLTFALLVHLTGSHAQGTVKFFNISPFFLVSTNGTGYTPGNYGDTTGVVASSSVAPFGYYYALLISAAGNVNGDPINGRWSIATSGGADLVGTNYISAGSICGPGGANGIAVDGWSPGASMSIEIVGWSASLGTTWEQIASRLKYGNWYVPGYTGGYYGVSGIGQVSAGGVGTPASPAASLFGGSGIPSGWNLNGVNAVPEPASFLLAGLGAAALLGFRSRKV